MLRFSLKVGYKQETQMNPYTGSDFDDFLAEEGIFQEVSARVLKRLLAIQLEEFMAETAMTKSGLAEQLQTSRAQVDRLLDPENTAVTLESLEKLARAVGRQLRVEFA